MDEGTLCPDMIEFDFSDAVCDTAAPFTAVAESTGKSLLLNIEPGIKIKGDETTLRQLVSLLLDNAMKYSTENSEIRLSLSTSGKNQILTVWNRTAPMPVGRHEELFERFYRPDNSRSSQTGDSGIGLSVAQAIVHAHKGKFNS